VGKRLSSLRPSRRGLLAAGTAAAASTVGATGAAASSGEVFASGAFGSGSLGAWDKMGKSIASDAQIRKARDHDGIYMFGDSLGVQDGAPLTKQLAAMGIVMAVDNWSGRPTTQAVDALQTWALEYGLPRRILMSIGTNDIFVPPAFAAQVDRTMQIAGDDRTVYWVNVQAARLSRGPAVQVADQRNSMWINLQLAEAARRYQNLHIVPWAEYLAAKPNRLGSYLRDGFHTTVPLGQRARNSLIVKAIRSS
jgi:hypothetical protein